MAQPKAVIGALPKHAPDAVLVVFETGLLTTWFHRKLTGDGLPAVCIDTRHAKAALDTAPNKTDANDADCVSVVRVFETFGIAGEGRPGPSMVDVKRPARGAACADFSMHGHRTRLLLPHCDCFLSRMADGSDFTLRGLQAELAERGIKVDYRTV